MVEGFAKVVCLMQPKQITDGIGKLCQVIASLLAQFAVEGSKPEGDPSILLDRLSAIFR